MGGATYLRHGSTGLMSITGVPSIASIGPIRNRDPSISRTTTGCRPRGFGRSGERVAKRRLTDWRRRAGEPAASRGGPVKPGDDEHLIANRHAEQAVRRPRIDLEPNVWCALIALFRCVAARCQRRSDEADRAELKIGR